MRQTSNDLRLKVLKGNKERGGEEWPHRAFCGHKWMSHQEASVAGENFVRVSLAAGPPPQPLKDVNETERRGYLQLGSNVRSRGKEGRNIWRGKVAGVVKKVSRKDMMKILHFFLASVLFL